MWCWRTLKSPLDCKEIKPVSPKGNQPWIFIGRSDAKAEALILWLPDAKNWLLGKAPDEGRRRRGYRGWDGWMASPTRWTWVWVNSGSWWWTGRPGVLQSMGSQRVGRDWVTELTELKTSEGGTLCPPSYVCQKLSRPFLGFNKSLLHESSWVIKTWPLVPKLNLWRSWIWHHSL